MERPPTEFPGANKELQLPTEELIRHHLDQLNVLHSVRNRFFPAVLKLADQIMSGADLTVYLAEAVDSYSQSKIGAIRGEVVRRMLQELPNYLGILMPEGQELEDTLALYEARLSHSLAQVQTPSFVAGEPLPNFRRGAPRGIKKIMDVPPEQRTLAQQNDLQKYLIQLGKHGLKQPSPRELAERQAQRERQRFNK